MNRRIGLEVEPIGGRLGATVRGLAADAIDDRVAGELKAALADHLVLFLPGLAPTVARLRKNGALFGPLETHPYLPRADDSVPEVCELDSDAPTGVRADLWHTDVTFSESPPVAALLHMVDGPACGGDTMWINCRDVFDSLSLPMQEFLTGLTCIHDDGWQEQVKFSCRWSWSPGDIALWDERATLHAVVDDTDARRLLRRVTVLGDHPEAPDGARMWPRHVGDKAASSGFYGIGGYEF